MARRKGGFSGPRFSAIYDYELNCPAYRHLSVYGRALLIEFRILFNGANNSEIGMSVRRASNLLNCSPGRAAKTIDELVEKGWIVCTTRGAFNIKSGKRSSTWRITNQPVGLGVEVDATKEYMRWRPEKAQPKKQNAVSRDDTAGVTRRYRGSESGITEKYRTPSDGVTTRYRDGEKPASTVSPDDTYVSLPCEGDDASRLRVISGGRSI